MKMKKYIDEILPLINLLGKKKTIYVISLFISCGSYASHQIIIGLINKELFDGAITMDRSKIIHATLYACITLILACLINPVASYINGISVKKAIFNLNMKIVNKINHLPMTYYDKNKSSKIMTRITVDMKNIENSYGQPLGMFLMSLLYGMGSMIAMLIINIYFSLALILLSLMLVILNAAFAKSIKKLSDYIQNKHDNMTQILTDLLAGIKIIKIYALETVFTKRYKKANDEIIKKIYKRNRVFSKMDTCNFAFSFVISICTLVIGVVMMKYHMVTVGTVIATITLQKGVIMMFQNIGAFYSNIQQNLSSVSRMDEFFGIEGKTPICETTKTKRKYTGNNRIFVDNVSFGYDKDNKIFKDITIQVRKGEKIAIIGKSGSGKSSLSKILLGFYKIDSGNIWINGKLISQYSLHELRGTIGYMEQENFIFNDTVFNNITCGLPNVTHEEVIEAAKKAQIHDYIQSLPEGYKTVLSENGSNLSGGQKQRIAIARLLIRNTPIMVFDECTSSIDAENEKKIMHIINKHCHDKTVIFITHNLNTIKHVDRIYVIDDKRIIEEGRHQELLDKVGLYYKLYCLKSGKENLS